MNSYIEQYYQWILQNPKKVNHKIKVVYKKLVQDIYNPRTVSFFNKQTEEKEEHTYIFDSEKATRPIIFIEKFCKHSKGKWAGHPVKLELWQKAYIQASFGFVDKDTGLRKYRKVILFVARKNGKSTLAAGIGNYMLTSAGEGGAEVYSVATKKEQAKLAWEEAKRMIKKSPALKSRTRPLVNGIFFDKTESFFKALASDSNSLDGLNAFYIIADEVHAWKDKNLLDVMYDSTSSREEPMLAEFSTMGTVRESVFDEEYEFIASISENEDRVYKLEGYLFPDTYIFYVNEDPDEVIRKFLDNFNKKCFKNTTVYPGYEEELSIAQLAELKGIAFEDLINMASLVQAESADENDMYYVSSIFYNRLATDQWGGTNEYGDGELNMLKSDATIYYPYSSQEDIPEDIRDTFHSSYNTYEITNLPPGAICNPGEAAIKAALNPKDTGYYYFCHKAATDSEPAQAYYATTYYEHLANMQEAGLTEE